MEQPKLLGIESLGVIDHIRHLQRECDEHLGEINRPDHLARCFMHSSAKIDGNKKEITITCDSDTEFVQSVSKVKAEEAWTTEDGWVIKIISIHALGVKCARYCGCCI